MKYCHNDSENYCTWDEDTWWDDFFDNDSLPPGQPMGYGCCELEHGLQTTRGWHLHEKAGQLVEQLFPLDETNTRTVVPTVRLGITTFDNAGEEIYYGIVNGSKVADVPPSYDWLNISFPGDSLRASYDDAMRFLDDYVGPYNSWPFRWEGSTCGSCGINAAVQLFANAPTRPDGRQNSASKIMVFLGDGDMTHPLPPGETSETVTMEARRAYAREVFVQACSQAKQQDIVIFTVAYGPAMIPGEAAHDIIRACASTYVDEHGREQQRFFSAVDAVELGRVMREVIPAQIGRIRILR